MGLCGGTQHRFCLQSCYQFFLPVIAYKTAFIQDLSHNASPMHRCCFFFPGVLHKSHADQEDDSPKPQLSRRMLV